MLSPPALPFRPLTAARKASIGFVSMVSSSARAALKNEACASEIWADKWSSARPTSCQTLAMTWARLKASGSRSKLAHAITGSLCLMSWSFKLVASNMNGTNTGASSCSARLIAMKSLWWLSRLALQTATACKHFALQAALCFSCCRRIRRDKTSDVSLCGCWSSSRREFSRSARGPKSIRRTVP